MENENPPGATSAEPTPFQAMDDVPSVDKEEEGSDQPQQDLPLAAGTEHQKQVQEEFHKQQEEQNR